MSATVIIPTTGSPEVRQAIESVLNQTYTTDCYIIVDGEQHYEAAKKIIDDFTHDERVHVCYLPVNVGAKGFYGHRVYAAFTHLINTEYVMWLDQDNWLYRSHVRDCINTIEATNLDWCYSLRQIHKKNGTFVCFDDCESLGKWQTYHGIHHIDTNSYCLKTSVAIKLAQVWHGGWGQDRVFLGAVTQYFPKFDCTGNYTVHYRVDGGQGSVTAEFFENGNKVMLEKYNGVYPWRKKT
jgi:glycosyltransferase involved in cell wall biosynthesis